MINRAIVALLPLVPRSIVWKVSRKYIAGTTLQEALDCVSQLNSAGMSATLDVLGEDSTTEEQALAGEKIYQEALRKINERDLDANISVKLSMLGLRFDSSLCESIVRRLTQTADLHASFVRIDMEDSSVNRITLDVYRKLRRDTDRVGVAVQAYLRSTVDEVCDLLAEGDTNLRVCKGIYIEPESLAYQEFKEVQGSFKEAVNRLLEGGATRVGIATHDPELVEAALDSIRDLRIEKDRYEFQMLLGVAERMRDQLVADGHPLRVYVPFGKEWYAYSSRRLRENPKIAGHVLRNLLPF
ncbi:MAG: proline dehydrogenase family protein [Planctomycetota bacterium]|nr:proline dehydrogenase family protein [Planctomycetota bacterium]